MHKHSGFTLVEFAVVMAIIGILIGGVLAGREFVVNARVKATMMDVFSYKQAIATFRDKYGAYPGDFMQAESRLPNCDGMTCRDGDGDMQIGRAWEFDQAPAIGYYKNDHDDLTEETAQVWQHLLRAGLISGVSSVPTEAAFGVSHPLAPLRGGFDVTFIINDTDVKKGHWLVLRMDLVRHGNAHWQTKGIHPLTEVQTAQIDLLHDDGNGDAGSIHATPSWICGWAGTYNLTNHSYDCNVAFYIDNN